MKRKKLTASMIALVMSVSLPMTTYAANWYLEDGSVTVNADNSGQTVTQGGGSAVPDEAPVITQRESSVETGNTIAINASDNAAANVTIKDINIKSSKDAIDVKGSSSANITLEGDNKIFSETGSALHISDGNVTINGSGSLKAEIQETEQALAPAKMGKCPETLSLTEMRMLKYPAMTRVRALAPAMMGT